MDDDDISNALQQLKGDHPSAEFLRGLEEDIAGASREYIGADVYVLASRREPTPRRIGNLHWLAVAAAFILLLGAVGLVRTNRRSNEGEIIEAASLVERLEQALREPSLSSNERLALLTQLAASSDSPDSSRELGSELRERGLLRVGAQSFADMSSFSISPDGTELLVVSRPGEAKRVAAIARWDLASDRVASVSSNALADLSLAGVVHHPNGNAIVLDASGTSRIYSSDFSKTVGDIRVFGLFPATETVLASITGPRVSLYEATTQQSIATMDLQGVAGPLRLDREGTLAVVTQHPAVGIDESLVVWDIEGATLDFDHPLANDGTTRSFGVAFVGDGSSVAIARESSMAVLDATTFAETAVLPIAGVVRVEPLGTTALVVAQTSTGRVEVWDVNSGQIVGIPFAADPRLLLDSPVLAESQLSMSVAAGGSRVATVSPTDANTIEVWSVNPDDWIRTACDSGARLGPDRLTALGLTVQTDACAPR